MAVNFMVAPTLALGLLLVGVGYKVGKRLRSSWSAGVAMIAAAVLAVPGVLMVVYYLHLFDSWRMFYEFRSVTGSELAGAGIGLAGGLIAFWGNQVKSVRMAVVVTLVSVGIAIPYLKPLRYPARFSDFRDMWSGKVCLQSTGSSCGPACAATLLRHFGIKATELEIARECFTSASGTENWYLARALRRRGLKVLFLTQMPVGGLPAPCIAGVQEGGAGHFVTVLEDLGMPIGCGIRWPGRAFVGRK